MQIIAYFVGIQACIAQYLAICGKLTGEFAEKVQAFWVAERLFVGDGDAVHDAFDRELGQFVVVGPREFWSGHDVPRLVVDVVVAEMCAYVVPELHLVGVFIGHDHKQNDSFVGVLRCRIPDGESIAD